MIAATRRAPRATLGAVVALVALVALRVLLVAGAARGDSLDQQLQAAVQAVLAAPGDPVQAGGWFGAPGEPLYPLAADRAMPAASVIKTAILIELFAAHAGHLDAAHRRLDPLTGAVQARLRAAARR